MGIILVLLGFKYCRYIRVAKRKGNASKVLVCVQLNESYRFYNCRKNFSKNGSLYIRGLKLNKCYSSSGKYLILYTKSLLPLPQF